MLVQLEIADDFRVQQADGIAGSRVLEARKELFGDGGTAEDRPALKDLDTESRCSEIAGARETVVAAADDGDVERAGAGHPLTLPAVTALHVGAVWQNRARSFVQTIG